VIFERFTHSGRLERWLGTDVVEHLSLSMKDWYGPPIAIGGIPGNVWAMKGGEFKGRIGAGEMSSALDFAEQRVKRMWHNTVHRQMLTLNTGFSSLSDLISEATNAGKRYTYQFQKAGPTGVANVTSSLWRLGNQPPAGAAPANAAAGTVYVDSSTGGFLFTNPTNPDTQHFTVGYPIASVAGNTLLLYDLLFGCNKTMNSTGTEAVTGVPTRYQNQTGGTADYIGGNFLSIHVGGTALAATAHNWTVCTYTDQDGAASTLPSVTGVSSAIVDRLDQPTNTWFCPLAAGDVGIKALTQMQCSALVATGVIWFMIGHPICWMPCPLANIVCVADGINTAFNLTRIFDDACLAFLEVIKPSTTATTYNGQFEAVAG
jgi:hypothetical protein